MHANTEQFSKLAYKTMKYPARKYRKRKILKLLIIIINNNRFPTTSIKPLQVCWEPFPKEDHGSWGVQGRLGVGQRRRGASWQGPAKARGSALTDSFPNLVFIEQCSNYLKP